MGFMEDTTWGPVNPALICHHCGTRGKVRAKPVKVKKGISGAKATAGLITAGVSVFAVGLSRKDKVTQCRCGNCTTMWHIA
jgi:hypothetical protein